MTIPASPGTQKIQNALKDNFSVVLRTKQSNIHNKESTLFKLRL